MPSIFLFNEGENRDKCQITIKIQLMEANNMIGFKSLQYIN
jgi:hypothetical protein